MSIFTRSPTNNRPLSLIVGMALARQSSATMENMCCSAQPAISSRRLATKNLRMCIATCSGFISSHLPKETANPLAPKSDEVGKAEEKRQKEKAKEAEAKKPEEKATGKKPEEKPKKPVVVKVDTDGIQNRILGLEITPGNYRNIRMLDDGRIFYLRRTAADDVGEDDDRRIPRKRQEIAPLRLQRGRSQGDRPGRREQLPNHVRRQKMLVKVKKDYAIIDVPKDKLETKDHEHKIAGLDTQLDRHAEWNQIYFECWRQMRDFFFSPTMNGVDWKAMRDKYAALLPFVNHRNDLTYLLGELIGELNNGHTYVGGGERPDTPRIKLGLLGAEFSRDPATRAYRIERILPGENWDKETRSPLTDVGVDVKPGDYILAINNTPVSSVAQSLRRTSLAPQTNK